LNVSERLQWAPVAAQACSNHQEQSLELGIGKKFGDEGFFNAEVAYKAMIRFLEKYYEQTNSDDVGATTRKHAALSGWQAGRRRNVAGLATGHLR